MINGMFVERLSSYRGNKRYGGVRQGKFVRNTNNAAFYLCLQGLIPETTRYFMGFRADACFYILSNSSFCVCC